MVVLIETRALVIVRQDVCCAKIIGGNVPFAASAEYLGRTGLVLVGCGSCPFKALPMGFVPGLVRRRSCPISRDEPSAFGAGNMYAVPFFFITGDSLPRRRIPIQGASLMFVNLNL